MAERIFWDTWAFIALVDKGVPDAYRMANEINDRLNEQHAVLITTEAVLTELGNAFSKMRKRSLAVERMNFVNSMVQRGAGHIIHVTNEMWAAAWELYRQRPDKDWGHTDCISFIVMQELGIQKVFTADHHFEQAGSSV